MRTNRTTKKTMPHVVANKTSRGSRRYMVLGDDGDVVHNDRTCSQPSATTLLFVAPDKKKHELVKLCTRSHQLSQDVCDGRRGTLAYCS